VPVLRRKGSESSVGYAGACRDVGGRCLSRSFVNVHFPLKWACADGHQFDALPRNIQRGHWCPYCAHNAPGSLGELRAIAAERGGKCLSTQYVNSRSPLKWRCANGHEWFARACDVKFGHWCLRCYHQRGKRPRTSPSLPRVNVRLSLTYFAMGSTRRRSNEAK
jgi:hypothetical protein